MYDLIVKNGKLVTPDRIYEADIAIKNGIYSAFLEKGTEAEAKEVIDAKGNYVFPGIIDCHAHLNEPGFEYREDFETGSRAAAAAGCTCPNGDLFPTVNMGNVRKALEILKPYGALCGFHCEEYGQVLEREREAKGKEGRTKEEKIRDFLDAHDVWTEYVATKNVIDMARATGGRVHICHVSHPMVAQVVKEAIYEGLPDFGNMWWAWCLAVLLICVLVCSIFGLINGVVISYLQVPAFIGTLGMQLIVYGVCLVYTNATPIGGYHEAYTAGARERLFGVVPYLFLIALAVGLVMWFIYNKTPHGKYMYAIGGNEQAAEVSGVNTKRTKIIIYVMAAALYALGGYLVGAKSGGASVNMGNGWELEAIAACTIGGVSVNGGIGRISGVLIGVLVFEILKTCLQYLGVNTNYQYIAQGIVIVVAIALDIRKYIAKK